MLAPSATAPLHGVAAGIGVVLCVGVPAGASIGLDLRSYIVGTDFCGFARVPAGVHLLHCAARPEAPRASFFFTMPAPGSASTGADVTARQPVVVARWDDGAEALQLIATADALDAAAMIGRDGGEGAAAGEALAAGCRRHEFDSGLGPYPAEDASAWAALTRHLLPAVYHRFQPITAVFRAATVAADEAPREGAAGAGSAASHTLEVDVSSDALISGPGSRGATDRPVTAGSVATVAIPECLVSSAHFLPVRGAADVGGRDVVARAAHAIDSSPALLHMGEYLQRRCGVVAACVGDHVLGELQATFVLAVAGESLPALQQWKRLVDMLMRCEDALVAAGAGGEEAGVGASTATWRPEVAFFVTAFAALHAQLMSPGTMEALQSAIAEPALAGGGAAIEGGLGDAEAAGVRESAALLVGSSAQRGTTFLVHSLTALASTLARRDAGFMSLHPAISAAAAPLVQLAPPPARPAEGVAAAAFACADGGEGTMADSAPGSLLASLPGAEGATQAEMASLVASLLLEGGDDDLPAFA